MGRNMMFSENPWGQLALGMKIKSQFIRKKLPLSTIQQDLGNIVEDVKNLGMIFNVQDKASDTQPNYKLKLKLLRKQTQQAKVKRKRL